MNKQASAKDLLSEVAKNIEQGLFTPKYQVERAISPFVQVYLVDVLRRELDEYYKKGDLELVCCEFPVKKTNSQSTNIDFLLIHHHKGEHTAIFVELKTDKTSYRDDQMEVYLKKFGDSASIKPGELMCIDLLKIYKSTTQKTKYRSLIEEICKDVNPYNKNFWELLLDSKLAKCSKFYLLLVAPKSLEKVRRVHERILKKEIGFIGFNKFADHVHPAVKKLFETVDEPLFSEKYTAKQNRELSKFLLSKYP